MRFSRFNFRHLCICQQLYIATGSSVVVVVVVVVVVFMKKGLNKMAMTHPSSRERKLSNAALLTTVSTLTGSPLVGRALPS